MDSSVARELGRAAVAARRWREACERFAEAQAADDDRLSAPDLELLSMALFLRGRPEAAAEALTRAHHSYRADDDDVGAARTAGWLALELLEAGDVSAAGTWVARGVRLTVGLAGRSSVGALVALVPAALTAMFVGDIEESIRRFDGIAAIAAESGDRELAAHAAFGRGKCLTTMGRTAEGFASLDMAMEIVADGDVTPITACVLYRSVLDVWHEGFDLRRAETWTTAFARWCGDQPELVAYSGQAHAYRAQLLVLHGEWAEASAAADRADERLRAGDFTAGYVAHYQIAELHRLRGEVRAARERYRRAGETGWDPQPGLALLHLIAGDPEGAQGMIRNSSAGADEATRRRLLPASVTIEVASGDVAAARRAAAELASLALAGPAPMLAAVAGFAEAQVRLADGDAESALESVSTALEEWAMLAAPYEVARCRLLRGRILQMLGRPEAARAELRSAAAAFLDLGAGPDLAEVTALTGERTPTSLTAREGEVLRLVATGLTNRAVAGRLSLSEKTVARHLSNIFAKLGLSSRSAATAYAYEHGLI
ncbi:MAG TPA: LuxR C-terminal-related transcriptional regulator [Microbacterium sp.]|nr:LuxR C-terminal-related transcriptional regulator [Microbacterium sp.]